MEETTNKKFYYSDGQEKHGPYTIDELKDHNIYENTLVWRQGMDDWKEARLVPDLDDIFDFGPPPMKKAYTDFNAPSNSDFGYPPKTWLVESILVTLFCCLPFGVVGIINASKVESLYYSGNHEEAERVSAEAKKWTMISLWIGVAIVGLYFLFIILGGILGAIAN